MFPKQTLSLMGHVSSPAVRLSARESFLPQMRQASDSFQVAYVPVASPKTARGCFLRDLSGQEAVVIGLSILTRERTAGSMNRNSFCKSRKLFFPRSFRYSVIFINL